MNGTIGKLSDVHYDAVVAEVWLKGLKIGCRRGGLCTLAKRKKSRTLNTMRNTTFFMGEIYMYKYSEPVLWNFGVGVGRQTSLR